MIVSARKESPRLVISRITASCEKNSDIKYTFKSTTVSKVRKKSAKQQPVTAMRWLGDGNVAKRITNSREPVRFNHKNHRHAAKRNNAFLKCGLSGSVLSQQKLFSAFSENYVIHNRVKPTVWNRNAVGLIINQNQETVSLWARQKHR